MAATASPGAARSRNVPRARQSPSRLVSAKRAILAGALLLAGILAAPAAYAAADDARRTLETLSRSIAQFKAGDYAASRATLEAVQGLVAQQTRQATDLEREAQAALQRCVGAVDELNRNIGVLTTTERTIEEDLGSTEGRIAEAVAGAAASRAALQRISDALIRLRGSIDVRQAKLKELERWFWVPGYGAYLGIRTLADDDITTLTALQRDFADERFGAARTEAFLSKAQATIIQLAHERNRLREEHGIAVAFHAALSRRMTSVRETTVFLSDAKVFWGDVQTFLAHQAQPAAAGVQALADSLARRMETTSQRPLLFVTERGQVRLAEKLEMLAAMIESGEAYTKLAASDCTLQGDAAAQLTRIRECTIVPTYPFYRMIDLEKCSFAYISPPGCPPEPAQAPQGEWKDPPEYQIKASARGRFATDRNWVDIARCTSPEAIFLGRFDTAALCESACLGKPDCMFWSYNVSNPIIPSTRRECWGGTLNLVPNVDSPVGFHRGVVSGGVACAPSWPRSAELCR